MNSKEQIDRLSGLARDNDMPAFTTAHQELLTGLEAECISKTQALITRLKAAEEIKSKSKGRRHDAKTKSFTEMLHELLPTAFRDACAQYDCIARGVNPLLPAENQMVQGAIIFNQFEAYARPVVDGTDPSSLNMASLLLQTARRMAYKTPESLQSLVDSFAEMIARREQAAADAKKKEAELKDSAPETKAHGPQTSPRGENKGGKKPWPKKPEGNHRDPKRFGPPPKVLNPVLDLSQLGGVTWPKAQSKSRSSASSR